MSIQNAPLINTYKRYPVTFVKGDGVNLWDDSGKLYIDCLGGIASIGAGHANKEIAAAICEQAKTLVHVSNLFYTEPMAKLAQKLHDITGWGQVFFGNSGAEANECAIKLARKFGGTNRYKIICAEGGFHGRTLASLAATGQPPKWEGFEPLPAGFVHAPYNDLKAFEAAIDGETAGIMVEPILGERGVLPATKEFLAGLRALCDKHNLALIFDEVQTGMGRTGTWWAFQSYGITPDILTTAKSIANGLPMGACIANDRCAAAFGPGSHGSTFGGGCVVSAAALATINFLEKEGLVKAATEKGAYFRSKIEKLPHVIQTRGLGLMFAAVLDAKVSADVTKAALDNGLVVNNVCEDAVRFVPPLVINKQEIDKACELFEHSIASILA